jgi:hypothetical protein
MSRLAAITLASALCCACQGPTPSAGKSDAEKKSTASKPEPSKPDDRPPPKLVGEPEGSTPAESERPPTPPWFDATKIQHEAVIKQMASEGTIAGGYASALVLELEAGVSNEQCIERAKAALGETLSDLPEATAGDGERLMLQGKTDDYHYTVVCGEAKGKPTMYLSYTAK